MTAGLRKIALTTHITASVGWLGSVVTFLALAITGLNSDDPQIVRAAYLSMHLTTWFVIVPFCVASFLTGIIESVGTPWGLFRHYWVVTKLLLTLLATVVLLLHTQPIDYLADIAARSSLGSSDLRQLRLQLIGDASAALFVLLATTTLSIYKPWGMTAYGIRRQAQSAEDWRPPNYRQPRLSGRLVVGGIVGFVCLIVLLHLFGVRPHH